jgi:hypothetical protein
MKRLCLSLCLPLASFAAVSLVCTLAIVPGAAPLGMIGLWSLLLFALGLNDIARLGTVFAIADTTSHVLKRLIFLLGDQPAQIYFSSIAVPTLLLVSGTAVIGRKLLRLKIPKSGMLLAALLCWSLLVTIWSPHGIDWHARAAAIHQQLAPMLMFFCGLLIGSRGLTSLAKTLLAVSGTSVVYGVIQFAGGPTLFDIRWAQGAHAYSIQANKVYAYVNGANPEFRPFSLYADPLTWGLLLVAAFVLSQVACETSLTPAWYARTALLFATVGLFIGLTRTPWLVLIGTVGAFWALSRVPHLRRASVLLLIAGAGFWAVVTGGRYVLNRWFGWERALWANNPIATRYATVGTLSARVGAADTFIRLLYEKRYFGAGLGYNSYYAGRLGDFHGDEASDSHNFVVELLLYLGVPGLLLFCSFYWRWLKEIFEALDSSRDSRIRRCLLWLVSFSLGSILSGYLNGMTFMSHWFFLILGIGASLASFPYRFACKATQ